jgi:hypothetical protein
VSEIRSGGAQIEALVIEPLLEPVLAPLADAMGEFGALVAEMCAQSIAARLSP